MIHTRRYVNKAKYAPKTTDSLKPLDVGELLKKEIDQWNISFEVVREVNKIKEAAEKLFTAGKIDNKIVFEDDKIKYIDGNERDILILLNDLGYQTLILNNTDTNE